MALGGVTGAAIALALPWAGSGRRWRSAFELLRVTRSIGFADSLVERVVVAGVFVVPVLAAAAWVLVAMRIDRVAAVPVAAAAALVLLLAVAVERSPLRSGSGVPIGTVASLLALAGAAGLIFRRDE